MKQKIRVALIYKSDYTFFNKNHFDQTTYYFFMNSLERNNELEIKYIPCKTGYDCSKLKSNTDVILLANDNTDATPDELINLKESQIPVICRAGDPHWAKKYNHIQFHEKCKIDYKDYIIQDDRFMRAEELKYLRGDSTKLRNIFGWEPEYTFETLMDEMIDFWLTKI